MKASNLALLVLWLCIIAIGIFLAVTYMNAQSQLFINTNPPDASIRILSMDQPFHQGMKLKPGKYTVEVSAKNYETKKVLVEMDSREKKIRISLARVSDNQQQLLDNAKQFVAKGSYKEAIEILTNITEDKPNWAEPHWLLSKAMYEYVQMGIESEEEATKWADCIEKMKKELQFYIRLAPNGEHSENVKQMLGELENPESSIYTAIISKIVAPLAKKAAYEHIKQIEQTIDDYTQAIALNPNEPDAYFNRGIAYGEIGQHNQAIDDYTQAIALNPKYAEAYRNRGTSYDKLGQYERAIDDCTQAITLDPKDDYVYNLRGLGYYKLGQYERAIDDYTQALTLDPTNDNVYNLRGLGYYDLGQYERAIDDYTQAIALNPKNATAYYPRGLAYDALGQYEHSIDDYTQAIALDPKSDGAYFRRGVAYSSLGQHKRAIDDCTQAIALNPKYATAYFARGMAYMGLAKNKNAAHDFNKYLELAGNTSGDANAIRELIKKLGYTPLY